MSRRQFFRMGGTGLVVAGSVWGLGVLSSPQEDSDVVLSESFLTTAQRKTLSAAVAQLIPASGPGDWSAADIGVVDYIDVLLSGFGLLDEASGAIYPSGPYRLPYSSGPESGNSPDDPDRGGGPGFYQFQQLSRVKKIGWQQQVETWQSLYTSGLEALDTAAGGDFAVAPDAVQLLVLEDLDDSGSPFFAALFNHTMEGAYSHPVYGGNQLAQGVDPHAHGIESSSGYAASWQWLGFGGDVHGVRFSTVDAQWQASSSWLPTTNPGPGTRSGQGSWNLFGGYAPDEMMAPGPTSPTLPAGPNSIPPTQW
jgi:hypothetical protein